MTKIAIVQNPPEYLDREKTIELAKKYIEEASKNKAELVVFPEAYISGYPTWVWRLRPGSDGVLSSEIHNKMLNSSVDIKRGDLDDLRSSAKEHNITIVVGMNEVDSEYSGSTIFNTVVIIGSNGEILNRHRKLMPTNPERMVWGMGDASGLSVIDTPIGRVGTLICWENYMPLARYALYSQGMEVLIAPTWDVGETWQASLKHIAREGGCWVLSTATALNSNDLPDDFPEKNILFKKNEEINIGGATVVAPGGEVVAGPLVSERKILYAEIDLEASHKARRSLDVAGHYSRPDIFSLKVKRDPTPLTEFED